MSDAGSDRTDAGSNVSRRRALRALGGLGVAGLTGLAGCSGGTGTDTATSSGGSGGDGTSTGTGGGGEQKDTVKAAWLYISEPGDLGWSWAHDQGRKAVAEKFDWLETATSAAVAPADSKRVIREYTKDGYDVVFGTTFEYMNPMFQVAKQNPDTIYEHCSGYKTRENMGRYFGKMFQARYLAGIAAGMVTEANTLGYVAAFPTSEVVRGINAFTLGARSVNSDVTTKVRWTNSWYDPGKSRQAANSLIEAGVDVMAQHQDSAAAVKAAAEAGIWSTGYDAPMGEFGGEKYVTAPIWHWDVFYEPTVKAIRNGNWESDSYYKGLSTGIVDLDDWGPNVPKSVKNKVSKKRSAVKAGDLSVWKGSKFEGKTRTYRFQKMGSYVKGVEGKVPSN